MFVFLFLQPIIQFDFINVEVDQDVVSLEGDGVGRGSQAIRIPSKSNQQEMHE